MNSPSLNKPEPSIKNDRRKAARDYLGAFEYIAHHSRTCDDAVEIAAALQTFAEPCHVLKRLAAHSRGLR